MRPHVLVFDTLCTGWDAVRGSDGRPVVYTDPDELHEDLALFSNGNEEDLWPMPLDHFEAAGGLGRKAIYHAQGGS